MKVVVVLMSLLTFFSCQTKTDGYVIKGELEGAPENKWLFMMDAAQRVYYDSVQLKDGRFEFRGKLDAPELRYIVFYKDPTQRFYGWENILAIPVYLENAEVRVRVPFAEMPSKLSKEMPGSLRVEGSGSHDLYREYMQVVEPLNVRYNEKFDQYRQVYYRGKGTEEEVIRSIEELDANRDSVYRYGVDFIVKHGDSPIALYVAEKLPVERYGKDDVQKILKSISASVRAGENGKRVEEILSGKPLYINDAMPDFLVQLPDQGQKMLSECVKKGRYTLVEFWASWCTPCRHDIPHLKETYKRFHDKGFDIVSVSIDNDTTKWKKALGEEKMSWTQVCGAENEGHRKKGMILYGANSVPRGFLIDPDGKVIHMTARGGWLNKKLIELFGK